MMKTETAKRCIIKIGSQEHQENVKSTRKTLKVLQHTATDKENLVGRHRLDVKALEAEKNEVKRKKMIHKSVQTNEASAVTEADLTSEEASEDYWRLLAEQRGAALNDSFKEAEKLQEQVDVLKEENKICKEMLNESRTLVEVLQEMLSEQEVTGAESDNEPAAEI